MKSDSTVSVTLEWPRRLLVAGFMVASVWYLTWRIGTMNPDAPWFSAVVYGAELFGFGTALLHIFMCWRMTERHAPPPRLGIGVDVFVPTYNESVELVRKTLLAARAMDYPHTTWLLDDGRRPEMEALARQLGCKYLARADNAHAKAGNLNHALAHSSGELVVVFDADHAPKQDFLVKTLGYFSDERVAFVQTPQDFYNLDSYQHRWRGAGRTVWTEQALFFRVIQRGKDYWNAAFFCGSCAVVRRSALDEIGGFATGTVTEDLHTSMRLHARGHKSIYHAEPLAFGLAPESIEPFIGQRVRWGQGAMHVWRKEGILTHRGLTLAQRLNYLASALTYFDGWQKAVFYFAPAIVLLSGALPLLASTPQFLLHFLPYYALTFWVFEEVGRGYGRSLFIEQYNMARFAAFAWATLAWIFPRMKFRVTAKGALAGGAMRFTAPQWAVLVLNGLAVPIGTVLYLWSNQLPLDGLIANSIWALINGALALAVISFTAVSQRNARTRYRFPIALPAEVVVADGTRLRGTVDDLSDNGMRFYGRLPATLAPGDALTGHLQLPEGPVPFWGEVRSRVALPEQRTHRQGDRLRVLDERLGTPAPRAVPVRLRPAVGAERLHRPHPHADEPLAAEHRGAGPQPAGKRALECRRSARRARRPGRGGVAVHGHGRRQRHLHRQPPCAARGPRTAARSPSAHRRGAAPGRTRALRPARSRWRRDWRQRVPDSCVDDSTPRHRAGPPRSTPSRWTRSRARTTTKPSLRPSSRPPSDEHPLLACPRAPLAPSSPG